MFNKILVVNRGEIAVRVIRACKELGITSAAVFSEPDKHALHSRLADEAYHIGEAAARQSYLNTQKIIELAKEINADAIHPGYGFLSENADFIQLVEDSGITFIGPSAESVRAMGSKTAARQLMHKNKVPIVPGTTKPITDLDDAIQAAEDIGFPVLLKASAGGGGKGMKRVEKAQDFKNAFESAQREALNAFGDDAVYIEKFIDNPKHIEVQIIADKQRNYAHLFERECSVQRRHQKIVEEAPSGFVDAETREAITNAAINAAKACDYENAGTIEFLMDKDRNFYFLEMNTRLQVEHPITELISGIDLVKEQISVAAGNPLSFKQEDLRILGHAIECRVYAEDPDNNFLPTTGKIICHRPPSGPGVRVDEGIDFGSDVTMHYDPLLSKLSVFARHRERAIHKMKNALGSYLISGIQTNIDMLIWTLNNSRFLDGSYSINLIDQDFLPLIPGKWKEDEGSEEEFAAMVFSVIEKHNKRTGLSAKENCIHTENNWRAMEHE